MKSLHKYKNVIYIGIVAIGFILISFVVYNRRKLVEQFNAKVKVLHVAEDTTSTPADKKLLIDLAKSADAGKENAKFDQQIDQTRLPNDKKENV
jgi:Na+-transporting NADH:ubiquinone oxidoreductase subunit NqrF